MDPILFFLINIFYGAKSVLKKVQPAENGFNVPHAIASFVGFTYCQIIENDQRRTATYADMLWQSSPSNLVGIFAAVALLLLSPLASFPFLIAGIAATPGYGAGSYGSAAGIVFMGQYCSKRCDWIMTALLIAASFIVAPVFRYPLVSEPGMRSANLLMGFSVFFLEVLLMLLSLKKSSVIKYDFVNSCYFYLKTVWTERYGAYDEDYEHFRKLIEIFGASCETFEGKRDHVADRRDSESLPTTQLRLDLSAVTFNFNSLFDWLSISRACVIEPSLDVNTITLTPKGEEVLAKGTPEYRLLSEVRGCRELPYQPSKRHHVEGLRHACRNGWVRKSHATLIVGRKATRSTRDTVRAHLEKLFAGSRLTQEQLTTLRDRQFIHIHLEVSGRLGKAEETAVVGPMDRMAPSFKFTMQY